MQSTVLSEILSWSASLPDWQRDALRRIFVAGSLKDDDVVQLAELCKASHGLSPLVAAQPLVADHMPFVGEVSAAVTLGAITHVAGVNALAPDQTVTFGAGLTIVYGDNGSGKSGYTRVLKAACRTRAAERILGNVIAGVAPLRAKAAIQFRVGSLDRTFSWEPDVAREPALAAISVFDSLSAPVYLRDKTDVAFRPFGLDVFDYLSSACNAVRAILEKEQQQLAALPTNTITLPEGTAARKLVDQLTSLTRVGDAQALATLSDSEKGRLENLRIIALDSRSSDPKQRARELTQRASRLSNVADHFRSLYQTFEPAAVANVARLSGEVRAGRAALATLQASLAENFLPSTGDAAWQALWDAARAFSHEAHQSPAFPSTDSASRCPLCQDHLSKPARERIDQLATYASSTVRTNLISVEAQLSTALSAFGMAVDRADVRLAIDELVVDEPVVADRLNAALSAAVQIQLGLSISTANPLDSHLPPSPLSDFERLIGIYRERARLLLTEGGAMTAELASELRELEARESLRAQLVPVLDIIERKKRLAAYAQCIAEASTGDITRKSTKLTKQLVTDKLRSVFQKELTRLEFTHLSVEIRAAGGTKGALFHKLVFSNAPGVAVTTVLSEGESRALSLAAFLTELTTSPTQSAIIFDDPVSSLDHIWRARIARRLVEEAKSRQVIVFTHDLLFLRRLLDDAEASHVECQHQHLRRMDERSAGICSTDLPWVAMNVKQRIGWLRNHWQAADKLFRELATDSYEREARYILGRLREAWEQGVSEVLLNGVVERFRQSIETQKVRHLYDITQNDCELVDSGMSYCSRWMFGHDAAMADAEPFPPANDIKRRIDELEVWVDAIRKRRQKEKK